MSSIEQLVRIVLYTSAGLTMGDAFANAAEVQGAIGGVIAIGNFVWWLYADRKAKAK